MFVKKVHRLQGFDYSRPGWYFLTICTHKRRPIFGQVKNGQMRLNEFGQIVHDFWVTNIENFENAQMGEFIVMPDHFHGLLYINRGEFGDECWFPKLWVGLK